MHSLFQLQLWVYEVLGLHPPETRHDDPERVERDLIKFIPRDRWTLWSHWLIFHGRRRCFARNPDCADCELLDICPTGKKRPSTVGTQ